VEHIKMNDQLYVMRMMLVPEDSGWQWTAAWDFSVTSLTVLLIKPITVQLLQQSMRSPHLHGNDLYGDSTTHGW